MKDKNIAPKREFHSQMREQKRIKAYAEAVKALMEKGKAGGK